MPHKRIHGGTVSDRLAAALAKTSIGRRLAFIVDRLRTRPVPNHWSNLFGVVTIACVTVVTVTGVILMFFYTPSSELVRYDGGYAPLHGATMSKALESTLHISFDVPGGLVLRQAHHWAALLLPASIILQLLTTFFTGGFRKPRRTSWVLLCLILFTALAGGWSGYALPDDMLSGTGLRIVEGVALGIPVVGTWLSRLLFGGAFPGQIIENLYPLHVVLIPVALFGLLALRLLIGYVQRPAQFPAPGRTEGNVVGVPLLPTAATRATGLFAAVVGILLLISATVTINPVWLYGPSSPGNAGAGSQPDWYMGFLDGALRLVPPGWEFVWLDRTWTLAVLAPLAVVTGFLALVVVYPFIEEWITGDRRDHHLLDRPRNMPTRTGIGVAGILFYGVLWGAGAADHIAVAFGTTLEGVIVGFQVLLLVGPMTGFVVARRVCLALQRKDRELLLHGRETGRIVRLPGGEYAEVHRPLDAHERWRIVDRTEYAPLVLRPDRDGRIRWATRVRAVLSRFFFEDRITPVSRAEFEGTASHVEDRDEDRDEERDKDRDDEHRRAEALEPST